MIDINRNSNVTDYNLKLILNHKYSTENIIGKFSLINPNSSHDPVHKINIIFKNQSQQTCLFFNQNFLIKLDKKYRKEYCDLSEAC